MICELRFCSPLRAHASHADDFLAGFYSVMKVPGTKVANIASLPISYLMSPISYLKRLSPPSGGRGGHNAYVTVPSFSSFSTMPAADSLALIASEAAQSLRAWLLREAE